MSEMTMLCPACHGDREIWAPIRLPLKATPGSPTRLPDTASFLRGRITCPVCRGNGGIPHVVSRAEIERIINASS